MKPFCQAFIARVPALYVKATSKNYSVSFESACRPGHFLRQKNYHYLLEKRDGTELFGEIFSTICLIYMRYFPITLSELFLIFGRAYSR